MNIRTKIGTPAQNDASTVQNQASEGGQRESVRPAAVAHPRGQATSGARPRSSMAFGARAAVLAGMVATTCAVVAPATASTAAAHAASHTTTILALGATTDGVVTPADTTCC
jgi:hypothetical protein